MNSTLAGKVCRMNSQRKSGKWDTFAASCGHNLGMSDSTLKCSFVRVQKCSRTMRLASKSLSMLLCALNPDPRADKVSLTQQNLQCVVEKLKTLLKHVDGFKIQSVVAQAEHSQLWIFF